MVQEQRRHRKCSWRSTAGGGVRDAAFAALRAASGTRGRAALRAASGTRGSLPWGRRPGGGARCLADALRENAPLHVWPGTHRAPWPVFDHTAPAPPPAVDGDDGAGAGDGNGNDDGEGGAPDVVFPRVFAGGIDAVEARSSGRLTTRGCVR